MELPTRWIMPGNAVVKSFSGGVQDLTNFLSRADALRDLVASSWARAAMFFL